MKKWLQIITIILTLLVCGIAFTGTSRAEQVSNEARIEVLKEQIRQLESSRVSQETRIQSNSESINKLFQVVSAQTSELAFQGKILIATFTVSLGQLLAFVFGIIKDKKKE